ncbi:hypothetical protein [Pseudoalteromonas luteoviolacea]|uniref:C-type lysozyme inhibitor domain-containing protein n=1 Tax=Pseudoalteromonas luteoviolacea S4054 TaxID=1129367 RepID=A0A0F6AHM6_9GAMM|nr:hypothetical protein [Pseudoalteromonas luteoviolacea]AOT07268.1 hypothetical protein S4054249_05080 [Pseudoalteromonas luteoviolacea]AOT12183.1 hypothetical protein S40542_05080 [Pseudoalteromonas luteoviolacea]AOT17096.1 hypothetical protein S4054_05080 [Pseudoalteromonas luteoviolacea]KKE85301.1 hypothetical protein N479_04695 [Pseudoalteromonas luteoviolacea S4054]KZN73649.1 hypothetical protein N481_11105 [Pseudoalteromonas luteoviolacea S4047-1]
MKVALLALSLIFASFGALSSSSGASGKTVDLVFTCEDDFAVLMGNQLYLFDSKEFSEGHYNRLYSMAMTMAVSGKPAGNVFNRSNTPVSWCGNSVIKLRNLSMRR